MFDSFYTPPTTNEATYFFCFWTEMNILSTL